MQSFVPPELRGGSRPMLDYNLLMVGPPGVGKYSLHHQLVFSIFPSIRDPFFDAEPTEVFWKSSDSNDYSYRVHPARMEISKLGDKIEQKPYAPDQASTKSFFPIHEANGIVLVYSIDSRSSFESIQRYMDLRDRNEGPERPRSKVICVIGNKLDVSKGKRKVLCVEGEELARSLDCRFAECSAKDRKGLDKAKNTLIKALDKQRKQLIAEMDRTTHAAEERRSKRAFARGSSRSSTISTVKGPAGMRMLSPIDYSATMTTDFSKARTSAGQFGTQPKELDKSASSSVHTEERYVEAPSPRQNPAKTTQIYSESPKKKAPRWPLSPTEPKSSVKPSGAPEARPSGKLPSSETQSTPNPSGKSNAQSASTMGFGNLFPYPLPRKQSKEPPPSPEPSALIDDFRAQLSSVFPPDTLDPLNPHPGTRVSLPSSRRPSLEPVQGDSDRHSPRSARSASGSHHSSVRAQDDGVSTPPTSGGDATSSMSSTGRDELSKSDRSPPAYLPMPEGLRRSDDLHSLPSPMEERRKLELETRLLEEERQKLREQMQKLAEGRERLAERRQLEEERKKIEAERKQIQEERRKIAEQLQAMEDEHRRLAEENEWFQVPVPEPLDTPSRKERTVSRNEPRITMPLQWRKPDSSMEERPVSRAGPIAQGSPLLITTGLPQAEPGALQSQLLRNASLSRSPSDSRADHQSVLRVEPVQILPRRSKSQSPEEERATQQTELTRPGSRRMMTEPRVIERSSSDRNLRERSQTGRPTVATASPHGFREPEQEKSTAEEVLGHFGYQRSRSAMDIREENEEFQVNLKRQSKDDSFLEPQLRNPTRSASRMELRGSPLTPNSSTTPTHIGYGASPDASPIEQADGRQVPLSSILRMNSLGILPPTSPSPDNLNLDEPGALSTTLMDYSLYESSLSAKKIGASEEDACSVLSDSASVRTNYSLNATDYTARAVHIKRVSGTMDERESITALPSIPEPSQQQRWDGLPPEPPTRTFAPVAPSQLLRSNEGRSSSSYDVSHSATSTSYSRTVLSNASDRPFGSNTYYTELNDTSSQAYSTASSQADRLRRRDEEDVHREQTNGGISGVVSGAAASVTGEGPRWVGNEKGYGYAVKPSSLPPIMEGQAVGPEQLPPKSELRHSRQLFGRFS